MENRDQENLPFKLCSIAGMNTILPLVNLTFSDNRKLFVFGCSHFVTFNLYNNESKAFEKFHLPAHSDYVRALSTDFNGINLLTADFGNESVVNVWNVDTRTIKFQLSRPHNKLQAVALSPNCKWIVSVGNEFDDDDDDESLIKIWNFKKPTDPPVKITLKKSFKFINERVTEVCFSNKDPSIFALTTNLQVHFVSYDELKNEVLRISHGYHNDILKKSQDEDNKIIYYNFFNTTFSTKSSFAFTGMTKGWIAKWNFDKYEGLIDKKFLKLENADVTRIVSNNGLIVTGDSMGVITLYNEDLIFLYKIDLNLQSIVSISFDISDSDYSNLNFVNFQICNEVPFIPKYSSSIVNNFIVATKDGMIVRVNYKNKKYSYISKYFASSLTAIDLHPKKPYIAAADKLGNLYLISDTENKNFVHKILRFKIPEEKPHSHAIALKYSPKGNFLICAIYNEVIKDEIGKLYVIDPLCMTTMGSKIFYKDSNRTISNVIFSNCVNYMGYFDDQHVIFVYKINHYGGEIGSHNYLTLIDKHDFHKTNILCMLFDSSEKIIENNYRLYSLDKSGILYEKSVKYTIDKKRVYKQFDDNNKQNLKEKHKIFPRCIANLYRTDVDNQVKRFVISYTDFKLKLFNANDLKDFDLRETYAGPIFATWIKNMITGIQRKIKEKLENFILFFTERRIGLILLPLDGNPYRVVSVLAHPQNITYMGFKINDDKVFTLGCNDSCIIKWKINFSSVVNNYKTKLNDDTLEPYYELLDGGKDGSLMDCLKKTFNTAQINSTRQCYDVPINLGGKVDVKKLPRLMDVLGFYMNEEQTNSFMKQVRIGINAKTSVVFHEFVRFFINHRPTTDLTVIRLKNIFRILGIHYKINCKEDEFALKKHFFIQLFRKNVDGIFLTNLNFLLKKYAAKMINEPVDQNNQLIDKLSDCFSYKDFTTYILGIKISEETRADN